MDLNRRSNDVFWDVQDLFWRQEIERQKESDREREKERDREREIERVRKEFTRINKKEI